MDHIPRKVVKLSSEFHASLLDIYIYGEETFGKVAARSFIADIYSKVWCLDEQYLLYPECRFITTKSKKYRNVIIGSYLIIYRVSVDVEVLNIVHGAISIAKKKRNRNIKL